MTVAPRPEADAAVATRGTWSSATRELWQAWGPTALFVAKTCAAAFAALWIAYRIDLPDPGSAMITVFIVSRPVAGLVLEKSLYRLMGTLVGSLATLAIVALFVQHRVLFMGAIAIWIGVCTAGATRFRNFQSYAFVLAGYTSVLIGFSAALDPANALHITIDRVSVVSLGILCAGFVSDGLLPQHLSAQLVALVRGRSADLYRTIADALLQPPPADESDHRHAKLIASVLAFESSRSAAVVESPAARTRSARLQRLNSQFMAVTSTLHALERKRHRLGTDTPVALALRPFARELCDTLLPDGEPPRMAVQAEPLVPALRALRASWPQRMAEARASLAGASLDAFNDAALMLTQLATEITAYTETYASLRRAREVTPRPGPRYQPSVDPLLTLFNGVRAAAALLATSAFWIVTAWPAGIFAIVNATIFSALFGTSPDPRQAVRGLLRGFALGFIAAMVCGLWLLPAVSGFPMMAAALLPFLIPGIIAQTQPRYAGMAIGYLIMFAVCINLANPMHYDAARLVNVGIAQLIGGAAALLSFTILVPDSLVRSPERGRRRLRAHLAELCQAPLRGLRHRFESATRDQLQQQRQPPSEEAIAAVLATLELGHAVLHLRRAAATASLSESVRHRGSTALAALHRLLRAPDRDARSRTLAQLDTAIVALANHPEARDQRAVRILRLALIRVREVLADNPAVATLIDPTPSAGALRHAP